VARLARVSHQTVSRVISEHPNMREETRLRVRAATAQLGYQRNDAARALVTGKSQILGAVAQTSTLYGPASMLASFQQAAAEAGLAVTVGSVRSMDRRALPGTGRPATGPYDGRNGRFRGSRPCGPWSTAGEERTRAVGTPGRRRGRLR
jgi:Bacterial regulatory proteins, lacI family